MNMNNIAMLKKFMSGGLTPKGVVKQMVKNNPIFNNLIDMAEKGDNQGVENFARNVLKERGLDFNKEFSTFRNIFK